MEKKYITFGSREMVDSVVIETTLFNMQNSSDIHRELRVYFSQNSFVRTVKINFLSASCDQCYILEHLISNINYSNATSLSMVDFFHSVASMKAMMQLLSQNRNLLHLGFNQMQLVEENIIVLASMLEKNKTLQVVSLNINGDENTCFDGYGDIKRMLKREFEKITENRMTPIIVRYMY